MFEIVSLQKILLFLGVFFCVTLFVVSAIMIDLWDGVYTAKVTNKRVHSHKLGVTVQKMSEYWRFIVIGFLIDCIGSIFEWYELPFLAIIFSVGLVIVEIKSMFEHAKKRKSHTTQLPEILQKIIECATEKDAKNVVKIIADNYTENTKSNEQSS